MDVTQLPDAEKDRDGFLLENVEVDNRTVPDRGKDEEDDLDGSQEKMEVGVEPSATLAKVSLTYQLLFVSPRFLWYCGAQRK